MSLNVYDVAADELRTHGHCRGNLRTSDGKLCLLGAIASATGELNRGIDLSDSRA